ncbi:glycosyltransferase family 2 protein [Saccharopolyspora rhizosphaerae]|uniref:Glycosyltransferase family 2 protein n=2 Tax=Saccharopolyspora rhizosphaerae TaxID=2492662 RepID=A0A3R8P317_9PSEU|nr:glycosyltransferase family 2 protein [Saccharopolyspora rhizosphaerae]
MYEEATIIHEVVAELRRTFPNVVCIDDGSTDGSAALARRAGAVVVHHPVNLGQGAALQTGIEFARERPGARWFLTFDADGQHQVEDAVSLLDELARGDHDMVIGTRFGSGSVSVPLLKRAVLRTVVRCSPSLRQLRLSDTHNGLRAFNRTVAETMEITSDGMGHASEIISLIRRRGWRVGEVPVTIRYTAYSMAKGQSLLNAVNIAFDAVVRTKSGSLR